MGQLWKKDFQAIARAFSEVGDGIGLDQRTPEDIWYELQHKLAAFCRGMNPGFDRERFDWACGIGDNGQAKGVK
jgi:hypothetical protein